jgi:hypothetical protein
MLKLSLVQERKWVWLLLELRYNDGDRSLAGFSWVREKDGERIWRFRLRRWRLLLSRDGLVWNCWCSFCLCEAFILKKLNMNA